MTTVGGASAAAAVTGIMGSSVGAAAVIAGFGAGGAHVVGGKMARRIGASSHDLLEVQGSTPLSYDIWKDTSRFAAIVYTS